MTQERWNQIWYRTGEILLTLYLYLISYFYTLAVPLSWTSPLRLIVIYMVVHGICRWLGTKKIQVLGEPRKMNRKFGIVVFLIAVVILGVYYAAYYPGGIIIDSFNQWYQVDKGAYVDWHPVIHTILFMKLPSLICKSLAFVNLVQLIWIALSCMYLAMVMERWGIGRAGSAASVLVALAVPASTIVLSFCWKDTALTIFATLIAAQMMEIVYSEGRWLKDWLHVAVFSLVCALAMLMRHNGVLLVGPVLVLLVILFWKQIRRYALTAGILTMVIVAGIKGPFYQILQVQNHSQVSAEMLGVPMTILANVLIHEPEKLDPECREFLYRIGDQELWEENYKEGNWNSAKWMGKDISNDVIEEVGTENVLKYTWDAVKSSPYYAYRAVVKLFDVVWKPLGNNVEWSYHASVDPGNVYGYETTGVPVLQRVLDLAGRLSTTGGPLLTWGWYTGFYIFLLLFAGVSRLKQGLTKCIFWLPVLAYDFGTALLLCGPDFRFFSFNTVLTFPLLIMIFGEKQDDRI